VETTARWQAERWQAATGAATATARWHRRHATFELAEEAATVEQAATFAAGTAAVAASVARSAAAVAASVARSAAAVGCVAATARCRSCTSHLFFDDGRNHLANLDRFADGFANRHGAGARAWNANLLALDHFFLLADGDATGLANRYAFRLRFGAIGAHLLHDRNLFGGAFRHAHLNAFFGDGRLDDWDAEAESAATAMAALVAAAIAAAAAVTATDRLAFFRERKLALFAGFRHPLDLLTGFHHALFFPHRDLNAGRTVFHHRFGDGLVGGHIDHLLFLHRFNLVVGVGFGLLDRLHHCTGLSRFDWNHDRLAYGRVRRGTATARCRRT
jgi:hypothetical protein